jgi:hypothetical protein
LIQQLLNIAKRLKYKIYERPYELNIWGIRDENTTPNQFDDVIVCFWRTDNGSWDSRQFKASTDPGTYWLKNPMAGSGTAIMAQGQFLDAYYLGHSTLGGTLPVYCLIQDKPIPYIRDYDRDAVLDFENGTLINNQIVGLWIHQGSNTNGNSLSVGLWSAGCQVIAEWSEWLAFVALLEKHKRIYGNRFSYTLVDERARKKARRRLVFNTSIAVGAAGAVLYGLKKLYDYFNE